MTIQSFFPFLFFLAKHMHTMRGTRFALLLQSSSRALEVTEFLLFSSAFLVLLHQTWVKDAWLTLLDLWGHETFLLKWLKCEEFGSIFFRSLLVFLLLLLLLPPPSGGLQFFTSCAGGANFWSILFPTSSACEERERERVKKGAFYVGKQASFFFPSKYHFFFFPPALKRKKKKCRFQDSSSSNNNKKGEKWEHWTQQ